MHEPIFASVEIAAACAAMPAIWNSGRQVLLKLLIVGETRKRLRPGVDEIAIDPLVPVTQSHKLATAVVNNADGGL
jgi:UTP:GlnB (protein PII) uridylyltransferase